MLFDLPGVTCFVNRLPCAATITPANLKAMEGEIARAASLIMPDLSVDTVFISCTNLRALGILKELENEFEKPVISSNAALGWHCLRLAGVTTDCLSMGLFLVDRFHNFRNRPLSAFHTQYSLAQTDYTKYSI